MSGHSKWSKVKHQKATTDVVKASLFTRASRAITVAVQKGGGITDPERNFHLRLAIDQAHEVNMPNDNIERAIAKSVGKDASSLTNAQYEAYGPGGTALLIETASDNNKRTVSTIKNILDRNGGRLGSQGSVSFLFTQFGCITAPKGIKTYDDWVEIALSAGADDTSESDDSFELFTKPHDCMKIKDLLTRKGIDILSAQLIMKPKVTIVINEDTKNRLDNLLSVLSECEDVQEIYTNTDSL